MNRDFTLADCLLVLVNLTELSPGCLKLAELSQALAELCKQGDFILTELSIGCLKCC